MSRSPSRLLMNAIRPGSPGNDARADSPQTAAAAAADAASAPTIAAFLVMAAPLLSALLVLVVGVRLPSGHELEAAGVDGVPPAPVGVHHVDGPGADVEECQLRPVRRPDRPVFQFGPRRDRVLVAAVRVHDPDVAAG